jgi:hypothetical protein
LAELVVALMRVWTYGRDIDDDPIEGVHGGMADAAENPDRIVRAETIRPAGQATSVRVQCECGGELASLTLPYASEDQSFHAVCPGCGTRYRRSLAELFSHTKRDGTYS